MKRLNKKLESAIEILNLLPKGSQLYWIEKMNNLCKAEKGFILFYLGHFSVNQ